MKSCSKATHFPVALFVILELALFPLIQLTPVDVSIISSYLAIILVVLFAIFVCRCTGAGHFVRLGLFFTLIADYFLVICEDAQLQGVLFFIVVQIAYFLYLFMREDRKAVRRANTLVRLTLSLVLIISAFAVLGEDTDALAIASVIYYGNLVVNMIFAFILGREERIFAIGLVLFAMCDLCIGLEVLFSSYLNIDVSGLFYGAHLNLPWVFYQPSQVLIALGLYRKERK